MSINIDFPSPSDNSFGVFPVVLESCVNVFTLVVSPVPKLPKLLEPATYILPSLFKNTSVL